MKNKPLPTARESFSKTVDALNPKMLDDSARIVVSTALKAMEEYKSLHCEALREENERLREVVEYLLQGINGFPALSAIAGTLVDHCNKAKQTLNKEDK